MKQESFQEAAKLFNEKEYFVTFENNCTYSGKDAPSIKEVVKNHLTKNSICAPSGHYYPFGSLLNEQQMNKVAEQITSFIDLNSRKKKREFRKFKPQ